MSICREKKSIIVFPKNTRPVYFSNHFENKAHNINQQAA